MSFILFPTWIVVNDINFGSEKVIQWVHWGHKVLTHGQERLFCKVTSVSIHSFVEWFKHWTMWYLMFLWNKHVYGQNGFIYCQRRYKYLLLRRDISYFVKDHSDSTNMFINMLEFLIDNIFVFFGGRVFQQTVGKSMGTNCAPLLADLLLYSYEADFIQGPLKKNEKKLAWSFNFTFRYIDDVLSLNNFRLGDFVDRIYPIELEIKDITDTDTSASYLDLHLEIDNEGRLRTTPYDKRDDFNFPIVNFPFICSNIPAAPAYGVYISQLIQYSRASGSYQDFLDRGLLLTARYWTNGSS